MKLFPHKQSRLRKEKRKRKNPSLPVAIGLPQVLTSGLLITIPFLIFLTCFPFQSNLDFPFSISTCSCSDLAFNPPSSLQRINVILGWRPTEGNILKGTVLLLDKPKTKNMAIKPTVALRAVLVGGIAAFAKIAGAMKAAGGAKLGAATAAMTAAATAALAGSKQDQKDDSKHSPK
ncbi:unnamed protein product [Citrullus colocynthis]|uniref:Uncharacterized protein n=1 Tax=Citrullus colocynthis TaxID=252529 RepID=A0ABP0XR33_9ROSI